MYPTWNGVLAAVNPYIKDLHSTPGVPNGILLPAILEETGIVTHQGCEFELVFEEHAFGPTTHGYIALYASDTIQGMEPVSLEDGLAAADDYIQDITDDEENPRNPTISE